MIQLQGFNTAWHLLNIYSYSLYLPIPYPCNDPQTVSSRLYDLDWGSAAKLKRDSPHSLSGPPFVPSLLFLSILKTFCQEILHDLFISINI